MKIPKVKTVDLICLFNCVIYKFISLLHCIHYKQINLLHCIRYSSLVSSIAFQMAPPMELLAPLNYHQWNEDMEMQLHSKRIFRLTMETEKDPIHYVDKEKYWNRIDEVYGCVPLNLSRSSLPHQWIEDSQAGLG